MPTFPNPVTSYHSDSANKPGTTNICGFSNSRVDVIATNYKNLFNPKDRISALQEIDKIVFDSHIYALGWRAPYSWRFGYWNKFGMPDHYIGYSGNWKSSMTYWWYEPELAQKVREAKQDKTVSFPYGDIQIDYNQLSN
jgi:ABC-type oligopeptide transport system substrate-binding subunit